MLYLFLFGCLASGLLGLSLFGLRALKATLVLTSVAFLLSLIGGIWFPEGSLVLGIRPDPTTWLLGSVITFISLIVQSYARRHLAGNRREVFFWQVIIGLTMSLLLFAASDHMLLTVTGLLLSNGLLIRLIALNPQWGAARASARLAGYHLGGATLLLLFVVLLNYGQSDQWYWSNLILSDTPVWLTSILVVALLLAACLQSAIFPFHRWLIGSANAPTPVSAFMHAGLVNGGALILFKGHALLLTQEWSFTWLILLGGLTALVGTTWMLVQSDVKRTLTCSTMGQMGFMIMQCGLGLFPAAIAHMIWHGFFKASLFLSAGSTVKAARNRSLSLKGPKALPVFAFGLILGTGGAGIFWLLTGAPMPIYSTYNLLLVFCGITCAHAVMTILHTKPTVGRAILAGALGLAGAAVYGIAVGWVEHQIPMDLGRPLATWHLALLGLFVLGWLLMLFRSYLPTGAGRSWLTPLYVRALGASRPASTTWTTRRTQFPS